MAKKTKTTKTAAVATTAEPQPATQPTTPAPVATTGAAPVAAQPETKLPEQPTERGSNVKASKSTVEKPTKVVWAIADEMKKANPQATRKEIVEECIRRGIAYYTARTQYQRWSKSQRSC